MRIKGIFRKKQQKSEEGQSFLEQVMLRSSIDLDKKVDDFIAWNKKNILKNCEEALKIKESEKLRNFIEKMAVWYELRYPDYEIFKKVHGIEVCDLNSSNIMFNQNPYINKELDQDAETRLLDWDEFYNAKTFINALPGQEEVYLKNPTYPGIVYWNSDRAGHFHLTKKGIIIEAEYMELEIPGAQAKDFEGRHIKEVVNEFAEKGIPFPQNCEVLSVIKTIEDYKYQKEELLNCVMYRIIERGGVRIGPRRAYLFAKEFKRNIDIPMAYGIDTTDCVSRLLINQYLKDGGREDLICYLNYFSTTEKVETIPIKELIKVLKHTLDSFHTPEEKEILSRLLGSLKTQIDPEIVKKEEVQKKRLQRKIEKASQAKK